MRKEIIEKLVEELCVPISKVSARANLYTPPMDKAIKEGFMTEKEREFYFEAVIKIGRKTATEMYEKFTMKELTQIQEQSQLPLNKKMMQFNITMLSDMNVERLVKMLGEVPGIEDNPIYQSVVALAL